MELNVKCHAVVTIQELVKKIRKSLELSLKVCKCSRGYKFLVIDTKDFHQKLELRFLVEQIRPIYEQISSEERANISNMDIVVFYMEDDNG